MDNFHKSNSNTLTLDGSPFGAERVPVTLAHAPPLYTRLRQEEGVGVQLLRLQPLLGHLYQDRGLGGVGVQLFRFQPFTGHLYQDRGLGGIVVQLLRLQPLPGHLYQDRGLGGVGVQLLRLQPLLGHLY